MKWRDRLNRLSSSLFFIGMIIGKGSGLKPPILGYICFVSFALLYFVAYGLWQLALINIDKKEIESPFKPNTVRLLYSFEYSVSATLGCLASLLALASFINPIFLPISSWAFLISTGFWFYAENKLKNRFHLLETTANEKAAQAHFYVYIQVATYACFLSALNLTASYFSQQFPLTTVGTFLYYQMVGMNLWAFAELLIVAVLGSRSVPQNETKEQDVSPKAKQVKRSNPKETAKAQHSQSPNPSDEPKWVKQHSRSNQPSLFFQPRKTKSPKPSEPRSKPWCGLSCF